MSFKNKRSRLFDTTTPFNTADWLAVADAGGTTTRKFLQPIWLTL